MAAANANASAANRELYKRFEIQKFLGKGSYGSVYKAKRRDDGKVYGVKEIAIKGLNQADKEEAVNEIRLLASIKSDNVIRYHEAFVDGPRLCIVMEYATHGDLSNYLKKRQMSNCPLPEPTIWSFLIQICRGLQALHSSKIVHRDIKAANILRVGETTLKLGDLGVAKLLKTQMTKTQIGTPHYMAPEIWKNRPYNFTSDVWALGVVLYEMAAFTVPFDARSLPELRAKVVRGQYRPIPPIYSPDMAKTIRLLLNPEASLRPTIQEVLELSSVKKHLDANPASEQAPPEASDLLATIQVPRNINLLKNALPAPAYPSPKRAPSAQLQQQPSQSQSHLLGAAGLGPPPPPLISKRQPSLPCIKSGGLREEAAAAQEERSRGLAAAVKSKLHANAVGLSSPRSPYAHRIPRAPAPAALAPSYYQRALQSRHNAHPIGGRHPQAGGAAGAAAAHRHHPHHHHRSPAAVGAAAVKLPVANGGGGGGGGGGGRPGHLLGHNKHASPSRTPKLPAMRQSPLIAVHGKQREQEQQQHNAYGRLPVAGAKQQPAGRYPVRDVYGRVHQPPMRFY